MAVATQTIANLRRKKKSEVKRKKVKRTLQKTKCAATKTHRLIQSNNRRVVPITDIKEITSVEI